MRREAEGSDSDQRGAALRFALVAATVIRYSAVVSLLPAPLVVGTVIAKVAYSLLTSQQQHSSVPPQQQSTHNRDESAEEASAHPRRASDAPPQDQHTQPDAGDDGAGNTAAPNQPPEAYKMPPAAQRGGASRWDRGPTEETGEDGAHRPILCIVCMDAPPGMMFAECGHCCCCEACVWEMATRRGINDGDVVVLECPQCRREGTMLRVYLP